MNMLTGFMVHCPEGYYSTKVADVASEIQKFAEYFNSNYYMSHDTYNDGFGR